MQGDLVPWHDFFIAAAGAAAALAGLLVVAISINLQPILSNPGLPGRAGDTLLVLGNALVVSLLCLVPSHDTTWLAVVLIVLGVGPAVAAALQIRSFLKIPEVRAHVTSFWFRFVLTLLAIVPFAVAGISLLAGGGGGIYWIVPGICGSFVLAITNGWVLLVEILR